MGVLDKPFQSESNCFCCSTSENACDASFLQQRDLRNQNSGRHENDVLLSQAMQKLTFEEREEQEAVLHGVAEDISEGAQLVENALQELDSHLKRQMKAGSAYDLAERMNPNYVHAKPFRIMFLRGNRYDAKATADQMLKFFEMKKKIFGTEKLTEDITIEDLDQDDISALKSGMTQFCGRDRSGRIIVIQLPSLQSFKSLQSEMRARYFFIMNELKSENTQLKGCVWITYAIGEYKNFQKQGIGNDGVGYAEIVDVTLTCPIYSAAVHFACDDLREYFVCNLVLKTIPMKLRTRIRIHYGSHLECQYGISAYGIHKDQLPFMPNTFSVNPKLHLEWFQSCFGDKTSVSTAVATQNVPTLIEPSANDVLYMGGNRSNNAGNHHLRKLVAEWLVTYDDCVTNSAKRNVVNEIINEIHKTGGRFLIQGEGLQSSVWAVVPRDEVRLKITQAFRNHRRKLNGSRRKRN